MKGKKTASWSHLGNVYNSEKLQHHFESLEKKYKVTDESKAFKNLVNMSVSKNHSVHRWVRYREGYSGDLVKEILSRYPIDLRNQYVLDPMCGSGSTNIACQELGIASLALDVNPYAILSCNVKTQSYSKTHIADLTKCCNLILMRYSKELVKKDNEFNSEISKYFNKKNFAELCKLKAAIEKLGEGVVKKFFQLALLAIVEDCSNRKKDGNGLATRPSPVKSVSNRFSIQVEMMIEDVVKQTSKKPRVKSICTSALELDNAVHSVNGDLNKTLGAIIFSPPYANSFDYFESYKLELVFGEYTTLSSLNQFRKNLIRNYRIGYGKQLTSDIWCVSKLCEEIWRRIPTKEKKTGVIDGRTRLVPNMLCAYFEDMRTVIQKSFRALSDGGTLHIVVDQSSYVGIPIPTDLIFALLGEEIGFKVKGIVTCRRANTSGQQLKAYPFLTSLLRESIISFVKK